VSRQPGARWRSAAVSLLICFEIEVQVDFAGILGIRGFPAVPGKKGHVRPAA
jgi:hypothetical protein